MPHALATRQSPECHLSNPHSPPALSPDLPLAAARTAFKNLESIAKCIVTAIDEAAPRACDLFPYNTSRGENAASNIGRKVVLRGLVNRPDLNGCYATIIDEPRCVRISCTKRHTRHRHSNAFIPPATPASLSAFSPPPKQFSSNSSASSRSPSLTSPILGPRSSSRTQKPHSTASESRLPDSISAVALFW